MQFHEFRSWWDGTKDSTSPMVKSTLAQLGRKLSYSNQIQALKGMKKHGVPPEIIQELPGMNQDKWDLYVLMLENEAKWYENRRPYYKVYPCVVDALCKLKLEFNCPCPKVPEGAICIRFAEGHEPKITDGNRIKALLVHSGMFSVEMKEDGTEELKEMLYIQVILKENQVGGAGGQDYYWFYFNTNSDLTIEKCLQQPNSFIEAFQSEMLERSNAGSLWGPKYHEVRVLATRIALTTCMLADDPEIITRDVLNKQQDKYDGERNDSRRKRMEDKARNNGVFGWSIGKNVEVSPHVRRPHWALRHTGPKGSVPQIVPVKGCKVNASKLTDVPNGHMLDDGTEVEKGQAVAGH